MPRDESDSEATRLFVLQTSQEFSRGFGGGKRTSMDHEKKSMF